MDLRTNLQALAQRQRKWYNNGSKGLETICNRDDVTEETKQAIIRWYELGKKRADAIADDLEKLAMKIKNY